ncbi:protein CANDIDATE G-PROTEIN COUPLED RECEPTOR 2-like [Malania oleifera]|uniref:protein CANDIDATE G-PROTEIN COUPLED RECEPTOR 2-like n=1 Tax=Malania oleifera TaxID=397392 RepID=UPI0025AE4D39|nr:protein CANDIDATE G-PROTEIN COUPLED RECEPTOR 2-like [Malania oleifera]
MGSPLFATESPLSLPPVPTFAATNNGRDAGSSTGCHGFLYTGSLLVPSALFVLYLAIHAKENLKKLWHGRSCIMLAYYPLLWVSAILNLVWCSLQAWQCSPGKVVAWNLLSLFTSFGMLCLEISLVAFLLQEDYSSGLEALTHTFIASGLIVSVDTLLKAIYVFGFGIPLFIDGIDQNIHRVKWGLWIIHKLLLAAVYGFILFVHYSKWREKLPPRPAFYNYIAVMFAASTVACFACGIAGSGAHFGHWLYSLTVICYHSFYLPFLYVTFLADFFQEDDLLLDSAYYSEMKDAGFFDADWD